MKIYFAYIHKDQDSDYGVSFEDFPGCITAGSTIDEALGMAEEALALHIGCMLDDNETIPEPSRIEDILDKSDGAITILGIPYKPKAAKHKRINITIREDLLFDIDQAAEAAGMTRSGYLAYCATKVGEV
ncbi:MAG: type II toxin-antitoxin system HicB family antitoxin [Candidatus Cloacimonetes bacterium]|nr:type II toxin-antitoxin system HicB family antitoxin [Candidatus Cloacimonadota bacterium]